ncbi:MAG: signal peptidase I [Oscillospiraceae bacterium]|jgi:signal peptidase I|nr:signal peptidase I [Oscillospiraceae bacterium]
MNDIIKEKEQGLLNNSKASAGVYDWYSSLLLAIVAVVLLLTFCFRLVNVSGTSMEATLLNSDKVFVSNLFFTPKTGDVVIISHAQHYSEPLVKRVIATEGQSLKIDFENQKVTVDGVVIDEPYVFSPMMPEDGEIPSIIPPGKLFVMGDNRAASNDSRSSQIGLIDENDILGKAYFVLFPFNRMKNIE